MVTKKQNKEIEKLVQRYPYSCSICYRNYGADRVTYIVFGYNKMNKMRVTSGCCRSKIVKPVLLGVCGNYDPDEIDEIMSRHPMIDTFTSN